MGDDEAVEVVLLDMPLGLLQGRIEPLQATSRADAIQIRTDYRHDALSEWCELHEELGYLDRRGLS
jgi:hypothetical protein